MKDLFYGTSGPRDARIMVVGESWGEQEAASLRPLVGTSGQIFNQILQECGILRDEVFCTNVVSARPAHNDMWRFFFQNDKKLPTVRGLHPTFKILEGLDILYNQIREVKPDLIITLGNYALWALTDCTTYGIGRQSKRREPAGIMRWRGSMIYANAAPEDISNIKLLPVIHPASIREQWQHRAPTKHDIGTRVPQALNNDWKADPAPVLLAPPTYEEACSIFNGWLVRADQGEEVRIVNDIETARNLITCIGFADSPRFAITIPFVRPVGKGFESYWSPEQEEVLLGLMRKVLSHENIAIEGQNYLYDIQYIQAYLACKPNYKFDSMTAHHTLFPRTPKGLDYLSSLYCQYHRYWKDDTKEWDLKGDLITHLRYNAEDCIRNFEVNTVLRKLIVDLKQEPQWEERMEENHLAWRMMNRGFLINEKHRGSLALDLAVASTDLATQLLSIIPQELVDPTAKTPWFRSPKQQKDYFAHDLGFNLPRDRKTKQYTLGKEGLQILTDRHPEFTKLFWMIEQYRRVGVFHNTFIKAPLDYDGRIRCMFKTSGTDTLRWASATNAFGRGTNLQNLPEGDEDD